MLQGNISFGNNHGTTITTLLQNPTRITFEFSADILSSAKYAYDKISDTEHCPREVLKFSPPPQNKLCDQSVYRDLIKLHEYGINITFHNVSSKVFLFSLHSIT